jgi:hypothetical protein
VSSGYGVEERGKLFRLVGAVGVHLDEHVVPALKCPAETGDVCGTQTLFAQPVQYMHSGIFGGNGVRQLSGTVRAVVIHDQDV